MFRPLAALALAALVAAPAAACPMTGKNELFMDLIRIGERSYHEPVPLAMPQIAYTDAAGQPRTLGDSAGKALIVTLWHPDCAGCKIDLPRLDAFLEDNPDLDRDQFVQISVERLEEGLTGREVGLDDVKGFLDAKAYDAIDRNLDRGNAIFDAHCLVATPSHLMINREGKVTDVLFGPLRWSESPFADIARNFLANY